MKRKSEQAKESTEGNCDKSTTGNTGHVGDVVNRWQMFGAIL